MHEAYLILIRVLALRTAELHRALAQPTKDPAFSPEPLTRADIQAYCRRAMDEAKGTFATLTSALERLPAADRATAGAVLAQVAQILGRVESCATSAV